MGSRIVRQPNGLFARFSEIVDHFTHMNLTHDGVRAICLDNGCTKDEAEDKLVRAIHDLNPYSMTEGSGLDRWNHCLSTIERVHGKGAVEEVKEPGERGVCMKGQDTLLSSAEMWKWLGDHVSTYASGRAFDGKNLSLKVSGTLRLTVTHGGSTVYEGFQIEAAIESYNNLI